MGLRTGTPDAEAATRHVVHAWISVFAVAGGAPHGAPPVFTCRVAMRVSRPGVGDRVALPRARLPLRAAMHDPGGQTRRCATPRNRRPRSGTRRACAGGPTSGTARPLGSSPATTAVSRAAARATTPFADGNGAEREQLAVHDRDQHRRRRRCAPGDQVGQQGEPRGHLRGRAGPAELFGLLPARDQVGRGHQVQPGQRLQRRDPPDPQQPSRLLGHPHRSGQYRVGHGARVPGDGSALSGAPSSAADARAARIPASAADAGQLRLLTGWLCTATTASRAAATAASTPGRRDEGCERVGHARRRHRAMLPSCPSPPRDRQ